MTSFICTICYIDERIKDSPFLGWCILRVTFLHETPTTRVRTYLWKWPYIVRTYLWKWLPGTQVVYLNIIWVGHEHDNPFHYYHLNSSHFCIHVPSQTKDHMIVTGHGTINFHYHLLSSFQISSDNAKSISSLLCLNLRFFSILRLLHWKQKQAISFQGCKFL